MEGRGENAAPLSFGYATGGGAIVTRTGGVRTEQTRRVASCSGGPVMHSTLDLAAGAPKSEWGESLAHPR
jgi:hypothetical protein